MDGVRYPSAGHYLMAAKARLSGDAEAAGQILAAPHPGAAKALGRQLLGFALMEVRHQLRAQQAV